MVLEIKDIEGFSVCGGMSWDFIYLVGCEFLEGKVLFVFLIVVILVFGI